MRLHEKEEKQKDKLAFLRSYRKKLRELIRLQTNAQNS